MLDITQETPLPLAAAARLVPPGRGGKKTHLSTFVRWIKDGVLLPDGSVVRLEAVRLGSRWFTSREALQRFAERQTPRLDGQATEGAPRAPSVRQQASERAAAELERVGI
jgi:hypothetical protein